MIGRKKFEASGILPTIMPKASKIFAMVEKLGSDMSHFVEHLPNHETYREAVSYVRAQAEEADIFIK